MAKVMPSVQNPKIQFTVPKGKEKQEIPQTA